MKQLKNPEQILLESYQECKHNFALFVWGDYQRCLYVHDIRINPKNKRATIHYAWVKSVGRLYYRNRQVLSSFIGDGHLSIISQEECNNLMFMEKL